MGDDRRGVTDQAEPFRHASAGPDSPTCTARHEVLTPLAPCEGMPDTREEISPVLSRRPHRASFYCMSARPSRDHRRADGGATRTWPPARRPGGRRRDAARVEMDLLRRLQSSDSNRQSALPVNRPPARETHSARVRIVTKHSLRRERTPGTPARSLPRARTRCRSRASYCLALREDLLRRQSQLLGRKLQQTMAWKLQ